MISWHREGQKVVTKPDVRPAPFGETWPIAGQILTIREVVVYENDPEPAFRFREIVNTPKQWRNKFGESSFAWSAFEPVYPQALDRLRELLEPTPEQKRPFLEEVIMDRVAGLVP